LKKIVLKTVFVLKLLLLEMKVWVFSDKKFVR